MLVGCGSLPRLETLGIVSDDNGDEGVVSLADGLRRGRLPSLRVLGLSSAQIGPQGATALASALTKRALPSLNNLNLGNNQIGDAGLAALAPALRQLPTLKSPFLYKNQITKPGPGHPASAANGKRAGGARDPDRQRQPNHRRGLCGVRRRSLQRVPAGAQDASPAGQNPASEYAQETCVKSLVDREAAPSPRTRAAPRSRPSSAAGRCRPAV